MNKKLKHYEAKLERISEKAAIERVDEHSDLVLKAF